MPPEPDHPDRPDRHAPSGVTIAIANWNHELVLPRAISSALAAASVVQGQGISAEVLVLDDGSRDGSLTLLRQMEALYHAHGLRVHLRPVHEGVSAIRNAALAVGTYRHLVFLDADNELIPSNLPLFYRAILDTRAAAVFGNLLARLVDGPALLSHESVGPRLFAHAHIDMCALFDRLQCLDAGGFADVPDLPEDYELYLHLVCSGRRVVFVPALFGVYYQYPGSRNEGARSAEQGRRTMGHLVRMFDQFGVRQHMTLNSARLCYHPDVGYL